MKKLFVFLVVFLFATCACAENAASVPTRSADIPLYKLPYDELVKLKNRINLSMWMREDWQEVTVPQGTWKVGEDIPAGHWTVKCAETVSYATINWGDRLDENGQDISFLGKSSKYNNVYNPKNYESRDKYPDQYSFKVEDGDYIQIENGAVVFMPYVGKPSFGFK